MSDEPQVVEVGGPVTVIPPEEFDYDLEGFTARADLADEESDWGGRRSYFSYLTPHLIGLWWEQVGRHHVANLSMNTLIAPAAGTTFLGVDVSQVASDLRDWVREQRKGSQKSLHTDLRREPWYDWMVADPWTWFTLPPAEQVLSHGYAHDVAGHHMVLEVRWSHWDLREDAALIVAPKTTPFASLVAPIMESVNFWEDHLWHFQVEPERTTRKTGPLDWPSRGARIASTVTFDAVDSSEGHRWEFDADRLPLNRVLRHKDQFWFLFDYGDNHLFRLRAYDGPRAGVKSVQAVHDVLGLDKAWPDEPVLVRPMPGGPYEQYPEPEGGW